jgi:hypothetical protein
VQRAVTETSDHLKILLEKPYLRPYFYDNKPGPRGDAGDVASLDKVKAMAVNAGQLRLRDHSFSCVSAISDARR